MRTIPWCLLIAHLAAGLAHAQTPNDLQVRLGAYTSNTDGGEKPVGVWFSTGPVAIGKRVTSTFSVGESCDAFSVSSDGSLREHATAAWRIDVTPTRVVGDAVTFRLRWQMAGMLGDRMSLEFSDTFPRPDEIELTLRPGSRGWYTHCEISTDTRVGARRRSEYRSTTIRGRRMSAGWSLPTFGSSSAFRTAVRRNGASRSLFEVCPIAPPRSISTASLMRRSRSTFTAPSFPGSRAASSQSQSRRVADGLRARATSVAHSDPSSRTSK